MKEALISGGPSVRIVDSPIPTPQADQVVIKVVVSGSNPKDWKYPEWQKSEKNQGDDIAGIVHAVGDGVYEFKAGDRVAAFHQMQEPHGSYAEYALAWSHSTFHIPESTSFEEAATIPLAAMTTAFALYQNLNLPLPWNPTDKPLPLIIYGAASAIGSFAIQLAVQSNIHPLICVAGRGIPHVESLIKKDKGDVVFDYREGDQKLVENLKQAVSKAPGGKIEKAYDCVSEHNSYQNICKVLDPKTGELTVILPGKEYEGVPEGVTRTLTFVGEAHAGMDKNPKQTKSGALSGNQEFAHIFYRYLARGLAKGYFKAHPYEVVPGGLNGVQQALQDLKDGKASAVKYVFRIADTPGVSS